MCDMNFQWYSLHPSISSSTSRSTHLDCGLSAWASTSRVDRLGIPVLLISVPSWYGDTKDQRADLRCSHQEFRHSALWLPKAAVAWWAWTIQCFSEIDAVPIEILTPAVVSPHTAAPLPIPELLQQLVLFRLRFTALSRLVGVTFGPAMASPATWAQMNCSC